jgi:hypothetical protein
MKVTVTVESHDGGHSCKAVFDTRDPRQVLNELRKGRNYIGRENVSRIHLEGDPRPFRVGGEKDTDEWLKRRMGAK